MADTLSGNHCVDFGSTPDLFAYSSVSPTFDMLSFADVSDFKLPTSVTSIPNLIDPFESFDTIPQSPYLGYGSPSPSSTDVPFLQSATATSPSPTSSSPSRASQFNGFDALSEIPSRSHVSSSHFNGTEYSRTGSMSLSEPPRAKRPKTAADVSKGKFSSQIVDSWEKLHQSRDVTSVPMQKFPVRAAEKSGSNDRLLALLPSYLAVLSAASANKEAPRDTRKPKNLEELLQQQRWSPVTGNAFMGTKTGTLTGTGTKTGTGTRTGTETRFGTGTGTATGLELSPHGSALAPSFLHRTIPSLLSTLRGGESRQMSVPKKPVPNAEIATRGKRKLDDVALADVAQKNPSLLSFLAADWPQLANKFGQVTGQAENFERKQNIANLVPASGIKLGSNLSSNYNGSLVTSSSASTVNLRPFPTSSPLKFGHFSVPARSGSSSNTFPGRLSNNGEDADVALRMEALRALLKGARK